MDRRRVLSAKDRSLERLAPSRHFANLELRIGNFELRIEDVAQRSGPLHGKAVMPSLERFAPSRHLGSSLDLQRWGRRSGPLHKRRHCKELRASPSRYISLIYPLRPFMVTFPVCILELPEVAKAAFDRQLPQ
jgi:hypothetical protein